MVETRESLLEHYRGMRAELDASLEGLPDERLTETTVDGWSVKDNLLHIAFWDDLRADEIERMSAGYESLLRMSGEQDGELNELAYQFRRNVSLEQARWELRRSLERLEAAIQSADASAFEPSLYGEAGLVSHHGAQHAGWIREWRQRMGY